MPDNHTKDDDNSDDEDESNRELKPTVKAYALLVYAYLRGGLGRVLDEFSKAADEIAPQLTGALSGVSVPARAWKPLGLAAVLLLAAVAIPAAPLGDDPSANVETQKPVEGETFETEPAADTDSETDSDPERSTLNGATLNELPSSFLGGVPEGPEPPEQVRASAGSQTMNIETVVVDGEPAIVLEDDRTHDGRWVSIETSWFEQHLGEIPNAAYVAHEDGSRYAAALNVRGDSAAFYVREFSTNTVTFDGEVTLSGEEAGDGTEFQYDLNATDVGAPSINLTGVETTQSDSVSARRTDGESLGFSVGGGSSPREETLTLTGIEETSSASLSPGTVSNGYSQSFDVGGNQPARDDTVTLTGVETTAPGSVDTGTVSDGYSTSVSVGGNQPARDAQVTITGGSTSSTSRSQTATIGPGETLATPDSSAFDNRNAEVSITGTSNVERSKNGNPSWISDGSTNSFTIDTSDISQIGSLTATIDQANNYPADTEVLIDGTSFGTRKTQWGTGAKTHTWDEGSVSVDDTTTITFNHKGGGANYQAPDGDSNGITLRSDAPHNIVATANGGGGSVSLGSGGSGSLSLTSDTTAITLSADGDGTIDASASWDEIHATEDPSVSIGGATVSHSGYLPPGETVTESVTLSPGSKTLDVSTNARGVEVVGSWTEVTATEDPSVTVDGSTVSHSGILGPGETVTKSVDLSPGSKTLDVSTGGEADVAASWTEVTATENPSVTVGGSTVSHSGILDDGQTVTESVDLSTGSETATVSVNGPVNVDTSWTEVTETQDPTVTVNGEQVGLDGTLADGETATLDASASWLQSGTNHVTVSTNSPASGPASLVTLDYSHGAETTTEATVEETTWSQTTTVANTWASARSNATVTVPMNDRVVDVRSVEVRRNGTTWDPLAADRYELNGTDLTAELGDIAEGSMVEVRATGSKVRVRDGLITVLEPTTSSDQLDTRVRIDAAGPNFGLSVDETVFSDRVHYADNSTWGPQTGSTMITAQGDQTLAIPNATVGAETTVRTWPVEVAPVTGQATVTDLAGDQSEPGITVRGDGNSNIDYTFPNAADGKPYILWSQTNEIVRDEGLASSPITLTDDNSDETLVFRVDDGSASGSGSGSGPTGSVGGGGAGGGPMAGAGGSVLAQLQGIAPSGETLLLGVTLLGGLFVVGRRTGVITEERQQAATSAAGSAASTVGGLVERAIANEIVFGVLLLAGGGWLLASGVLPEQTTLIVSLAAVPVAMFLVLQQFDRFDFRIWAGSTALVGVLGLQVLAPELFETIAEEAGVIIVAGGLLLAWRAVSAWRAEANTPDEVNRIEISGDDGEN